jgi:hypothetical protein
MAEGRGRLGIGDWEISVRRFVEIGRDWWRFLSEVGENKTAAAFWEFKGAHLREVR